MMQNILDKHIKFWEGKNETPILGTLQRKKWISKPYPRKNGNYIYQPQKITYTDIDPAQMMGKKDFSDNDLHGELIVPIGCIYPEAWMEGILGCKIIASENSCSSMPLSKSVLDVLNSFDYNRCVLSGWYKKAEETMKYFVSHSLSSPVRQLHLRGLADILAAVLSETTLCMSLYDSLDILGELADKYTRLYVDIYKRLAKLNKTWYKGYVSSWKIFSPGEILDYQIDASNLFSVSQYEDAFLKHDEEIINKFDYSIVHVHSCGLRHVESLISIDKLGAIEINLDRETNAFNMDEIISYINLIQEYKKGVILVGRLNDIELKYLLSRVLAGGLAIDRWVEEC